MTKNGTNCLYCQRGSQQAPLIQLEYKDQTYWICPQHLPILIHDPSKLEGLLPGAGELQPAEGHDH